MSGLCECWPQEYLTDTEDGCKTCEESFELCSECIETEEVTNFPILDELLFLNGNHVQCTACQGDRDYVLINDGQNQTCEACSTLVGDGCNKCDLVPSDEGDLVTCSEC